MGHSGVCGASYIVEVLNIVCANSQQHVHATRMCVGICKHFVHHYWFTSFIPMSWSMPYIYYGMLEHALLALSMYVYRHSITVFTAWNRSIYTNVHLTLYNIYIIARSGMYNIYIWLWKSTLACHGHSSRYVVSRSLVPIALAHCTMHDKIDTVACYSMPLLWFAIGGLVAWVGGVVASAITGVSGRFRR